MKRAVKALIAVYFAAFMCIFGGMTAFTVDDTNEVDVIKLMDIPDGAYFADVLIKDDVYDSHEVVFYEEHAEYLELNSNCELAKYDDDGYTSFLLRHKADDLGCFQSYSDEKCTSIGFYTLNETNSNRYFIHFDRLKIAYCDKQGNILSVTDELNDKYVSMDYPVIKEIRRYGYNMDECLKGSDRVWEWILVGVLIVSGIIVLAITIFVIGKIKNHMRDVKMIRRIQSGELDNQ